MKKIIFLVMNSFLLSTFFIPLSTMAQIPLNHLTNLDSPLKKEFINFSPVPGIILQETHLLKNIYHLSAPGAVRTLSHSLFYPVDAYTLRPTQTKFRVGEYLHPQLIGKIIGFLHKYKDFDLKKEGKKGLESRVLELVKMIEQDSLVKSQSDKNEKEAKNLLDQYLQLEQQNEREKINVIRGDLHKYLHFQKSALDKLTPDNKNDFLKKNFHEKLSKEIKEFSHLVFNQNHRLEIKILLQNFLWGKVQQKTDYLSYYRGIEEILGMNIVNSQNIYNENAVSHEIFKSSQYFTIPTIPPEKYSLVDLLYALKTKSVKHEPLVNQDNSIFQQESFPDCGESSLRNFFKIILGRGSHYDVNILQKIKNDYPELDPSLIDFFKNYPTPQSQLSYEARMAWAQITSGVKGVKYSRRDPVCELEIGADNILQLIHTLLGLPPLPPVQNLTAEEFHTLWNNLIQLFNQYSHRPVKIEQMNIDLDSDRQAFLGRFQLHTPHQGKFNWYFQRSHFFIQPLNKGEANELLHEELNILKKLYEGADPEEAPALFFLFSFYPIEILKSVFTDINLAQKMNNLHLPLSHYIHFTDDQYWTNYIKFLKEKTPAEERGQLFSNRFVEGVFQFITSDQEKINFIKEAPAEALENYISLVVEEDKVHQRFHLKPFLQQASEEDRSGILKILISSEQNKEKFKDLFSEIFQGLKLKNKLQVLTELLPLMKKDSFLLSFLKETMELIKSKLIKKSANNNLTPQELTENSSLKSIVQFHQAINEILFIEQNNGDEFLLCHPSLLEFGLSFQNSLEKILPHLLQHDLLTSMLALAVTSGDLALIKMITNLEGLTAEDLNKKIGNKGTVLHLAIKEQQTAAAKILLDSPLIDLNATNIYLERPLHLAAQENNLEVTTILLSKKNLKPNLTDSNNATPLYDAVTGGHISIIQSLLQDPRVDVNKSDIKGDTVLTQAVKMNLASSVETLLRSEKLNINGVDFGKNTALHWAVITENAKMVKLLLQHPDLDLNLKNNDQQTAKDLAEVFDNKEIIKLFK